MKSIIKIICILLFFFVVTENIPSKYFWRILLSWQSVSGPIQPSPVQYSLFWLGKPDWGRTNRFQNFVASFLLSSDHCFPVLGITWLISCQETCSKYFWKYCLLILLLHPQASCLLFVFTNNKYVCRKKTLRRKLQ